MKLDRLSAHEKRPRKHIPFPLYFCCRTSFLASHTLPRHGANNATVVPEALSLHIQYWLLPTAAFIKSTSRYHCQSSQTTMTPLSVGLHAQMPRVVSASRRHYGLGHCFIDDFFEAKIMRTTTSSHGVFCTMGALCPVDIAVGHSFHRHNVSR